MESETMRIISKADKDLRANGVTGYAISVRCPDSGDVIVRFGKDEACSYGLSEHLKVYLKKVWEHDADKRFRDEDRDSF